MWHDNFSISARFSQVEILLQRQVSKIRAFMEMSNGNVAQTPNQEWQLCVIICSFVHSSFFMQSKNIISCEIMIPPSKAIGQPFISRSQPEKCFFYSAFSIVLYTKGLIWHPAIGLWGNVYSICNVLHRKWEKKGMSFPSKSNGLIL